MGTSNWQQIPFCIEALMKIAPARVLDVGVGFGRWGIITREFCDVWFSRVFREEWKVQVEGIEAFPKSIDEYHHRFYNTIHQGDAAKIIPSLKGPYDAVMFGDVLEHFTKETATALLNNCLDKSAYVIVNIPLGEDWEQGAAYGNEFERHLSAWEPEDFLQFGLVRKAVLSDYIGRPHGSFILSRNDPKDLRSGLFSGVPTVAGQGMLRSAEGELEIVVRKMEELANELAHIKGHSSYRLATRLRKSGVWNAARYAANRNRRIVSLTATGEKNPASQGTEVWLLHAGPNAGDRSIPWDFLEDDGSWEARAVERCPYGRCAVSSGGTARIPADKDPELRFMRHPWSGKATIHFGGRTETIDLFAANSDEIAVFPARTPMVQPLETDAASLAPAGLVGSLLAPEPTTNKNGAAVELKPKRTQFVPGSLTPDEKAFVESFKKSGVKTLAIHCPRWLGVTNATRVLLPACYPVPATVDADPFAITDEELECHSAVIAMTGVNHVVFSGGDEFHYRLMHMIRRRRPEVRFDLLWHGNYTHFGDDYVWGVFQKWVDAARAGIVRKIGTVKAGMERFLKAAGAEAALVLNYVPGEPMPPPRIDDADLHIGIWSSGSTFMKTPHPMLAALKMIPGAKIHGAGLAPRVKEVVEFLGLKSGEVIDTPLPHADLMAAIRRTHLTLNVTFAECCPMLPLESMNMGVPCLMGPASHLFEDNKFLHDRLVVPSPDRAEVIADYALRAVKDRDAIMAEYARYIPGYNARAKASVEAFLA